MDVAIQSPARPATLSNGQGSTAIAWIAIIAFGIAFFLIEHDLMTSSREMFGTTSDVLQSNATEGHGLSHVGITMLAILGGALLWTRNGRRWSFYWPLVIPIALYVGWSAASVLWSASPAMTISRVGSLVFCVIGAVGLARRLTLRQMCQATLAISAAYILIGLAAEMALGTFHPFSSEYRFAGTIHPNGQGIVCAYLALASIMLLSTSKHRGWLILLLLLAMVCMVLTKSRTSLFSLFAALAVIALMRASLRSVLIATTGVIAALALVVLIAQSAGPEYSTGLKEGVMLGREEHAETLSGRTELWEEMSHFAKRRLFLGYGFRSFWTPQRIEEISGDQFWGMNSAHSLYLDTVLSTGLIGLAFLILLGGIGLIMAGYRWRRTGDPGYGLILGSFLCGAISGLLESAFVAPSMESFLAGMGLSYIALFSGKSDSYERSASSAATDVSRGSTGTSCDVSRSTSALGLSAGEQPI